MSRCYKRGMSLDIGRQDHRARVAMAKIKKQFPEEGAMFCSVLERTIMDLVLDDWRGPATAYLNGNMWHVQMCGVDPDWVRDQLKKANVCFHQFCTVSVAGHVSDKCTGKHDHLDNSVSAKDMIAGPSLRERAIQAINATKHEHPTRRAPTKREFYDQKKRILETIESL